MSDKVVFKTGYFIAPNDIFDVEDLKIHDKLVYMYICRCGHNSKAFPSYNTIAKKCSTSRSSAMRAVKVLQDKGLLIKHMRRNSDDDRHKSNVYEVVPPSVRQEPPNVSETPYKVTTDKTTKDIKRYAITSNSAPVFQYYNFKYKEHFNKDHPTVTMEQLDELEGHLNSVMGGLDISEDSMMDCIDEHFEKLSDKNDGKMFSFLSPDGDYGVLKRLYGY